MVVALILHWNGVFTAIVFFLSFAFSFLFKLLLPQIPLLLSNAVFPSSFVFLWDNL
jgi:hypothetical protein